MAERRGASFRMGAEAVPVREGRRAGRVAETRRCALTAAGETGSTAVTGAGCDWTGAAASALASKKRTPAGAATGSSVSAERIVGAVRVGAGAAATAAGWFTLTSHVGATGVVATGMPPEKKHQVIAVKSSLSIGPPSSSG